MIRRLACCNLSLVNKKHIATLVRATNYYSEDGPAPIVCKDWSYCPFCGVELER
jgi:hypothetical protein